MGFGISPLEFLLLYFLVVYIVPFLYPGIGSIGLCGVLALHIFHLLLHFLHLVPGHACYLDDGQQKPEYKTRNEYEYNSYEYNSDNHNTTKGKETLR